MKVGLSGMRRTWFTETERLTRAGLSPQVLKKFDARNKQCDEFIWRAALRRQLRGGGGVFDQSQRWARVGLTPALLERFDRQNRIAGALIARARSKSRVADRSY
jgi:hypothetical protein